MRSCERHNSARVRSPTEVQQLLATQRTARHRYAPPGAIMARMSGGVFISYRRGDATGYAGRLYDRLRTRLPNRTFMDAGEIAPGADFDVTISNALASCKVLIAMIAPDWAAGRLNNPADYVRREIAAALRSGIRVVPVLIHGAAMPSESELPEDLKPLAHRQALVIDNSSWDAAYEQLLGVIEAELGVQRHTQRRRLMWAAGGTAAVVIALVLVAPSALQRARSSGPSRTENAPSGRPADNTTLVPVTGEDHTARDGAQKSAAQNFVQQEVRALDNATSVMSGIADQIGGVAAKAAPPDAFLAATWEIKPRGRKSDSVLVLKPDHTLDGRWSQGTARGTWSYDEGNLLRLQFRSPSVPPVVLKVPPIPARDARGEISKPRMFAAKDGDGSTIEFVRKGN